MNEKNVIGIIGLIGFAIITFTPVIPLMLNNYGIDNIIYIKAVIGMLSLACGYAIAYGFLFKSDKPPSSKEGKLKVNLILMIIGLILITLAWISNLPQMLADFSGLGETFDFGDDLGMPGGLGVRIFTSLLTVIGVLLIKLSMKRETHVVARLPDSEKTYAYMSHRGDEY
jgi:hypothetical protein